MDNIGIETQPIGRVETPIIPEVPAEMGSIKTPASNTNIQESPNQEIPAVKTEEPIGVEVSAETPKPSAGFAIDPNKNGASRIVLEKIIRKVENL